MKIYVVGNSKNNFLPLDNIREKFIVDEVHEGDNVDSLNPYYCEMTGLYYLWKHCDEEIVGLEHYRRYFGNQDLSIINEEQINEILKTHDIIVDNVKMPFKNYSGWYQNTIMGRIDEIKRGLLIVKTLYPEIYPSIESYLHEHDVIEGNMFVARKELMNEYFEFIFTVLRTYIESMKHFNLPIKPRICGFIAEYFFGGWIKYKQLKTYENKRIFVDKQTGKKSFYR